ncbi:MAG: Panacea domain-containing protein [bacterium]
MPINKKKYEQVIIYLCSKLGGEIRGKKKLAKLLYYSDFDFFEKNQKSITGDTYKALPMGPFPTKLEEVIVGMKGKKEISVKAIKEREGYAPTEIYNCSVKPDLLVFNKDEVKMLDRVIIKYGHLTGKQLEDLTHAEAPYIGTLLKNEIPYELTHYRGTDFSDL